MFQFVEFEFPNKYKFIAFGNSIHAIALSIQKGFFPKDNIQLYPASESGIYVSFLSEEQFNFERNEFYHLVWYNNTISLYYRIDENVPFYCMPDLSEEITNDTWEIIYGKYFKHLMPPLVEENTNNDFEDENITQTDQEWDQHEEYDVNYTYYSEDDQDYYEDNIVLYKKQKYEYDDKIYRKGCRRFVEYY